jgi:sterol-4alpha-carboxylate 3-dehydrogenase (decarboxylating)
MDPRACDIFKNDPRVQFIRGDVTKYEQLVEAVRGADVVYATFAIIRFMDSQDHQAALSYRINVEGTQNVVKACQECQVKMLIQTSTGNVAVATEQNTLAMDEKVPYVTRENSPNHYGWTKAIAEQIVLKADGVNGVRTAAIRPCSAVYGANDGHFLDPILKLGRTILPPNGGSAVMDFVSVMNVCWAHLLLEKALWDRPDSGVAGEAYCVSNNEPMRMVDLCALVNALRPGGVAVIPTPQRLLIGISYVVELVTYMGYKVPGQLGTLTKTTVNFLDMNFAFSTRKAKEKLGYEPIFSMENAIQMSVDEWQLGQLLPLLPS